MNAAAPPFRALGAVPLGAGALRILASPAAAPRVAAHWPADAAGAPLLGELRLSVLDREPFPAPPAGAVDVAFLDGVVRGWHLPATRVTTAAVPGWLLADGAIRALDHLLLPLFYEHEGWGPHGLEAALLHASAVEVRPGEAALFLAPSEGGKSTIARLAGARPVLHDEVVIVEHADGRAPAVRQGSWSGYRTAGSRRAVPLRGLFLLEKSDACAARPADDAESHARVLVQVVRADDLHVRAAHDVFGAMADFVERLARAVPPAALAFRPDPAVWTAVERALR